MRGIDPGNDPTRPPGRTDAAGLQATLAAATGLPLRPEVDALLEALDEPPRP